MNPKTIAINRKAHHDYHLQGSWEAGLVLTGTEIKSIRSAKVNIRDAYAQAQGGEMWLHQAHIAPYEKGNIYNHAPLRPRKLLLHKAEIRAMTQKAAEKGLTLVPKRLYVKNGYAKVELALAKGKKAYDHREDIAKRDARRSLERELASRR
ncbi:MAG: SsrA-binding protein SmpB [Chloroflexi bacterium]|nr:SsrA-binding protein SmpB [Chloroflexota bacterium]MBI4216559.1 SsrA-binding protein SmpB [Chloroflexota bacterium]